MTPKLSGLYGMAGQGNEIALQDLLVALSGRLHAYTYSILRHKEDAEDAAQQAGLQLVKTVRRPTRAYEFLDERKFEAFVFLIAARAAWRTRKTRLPLVDLTDDRLIELMDPISEDETIDTADDLLVVLEVLDTLEPPDRMLVERMCLFGFSSSEIAAITDGNPATIRSRLASARKRLMAAVERRDPELARRLFA